MNFDEKDLEITTCKSPKTNLLGAEVGVKIKHKKLDITVQSIDLPTQHQNKLAAIELMKEAVVKSRFENINEDDLMDGEEFFKQLRELDDHDEKLTEESFKEYVNAFRSFGPNECFNNINIFKGWQNYADEAVLKSLDQEVARQLDFIRINDIKSKHGRLVIIYDSFHDVDYDDFIEQLTNLSN